LPATGGAALVVTVEEHSRMSGETRVRVPLYAGLRYRSGGLRRPRAGSRRPGIGGHRQKAGIDRERNDALPRQSA